MNLDKSRLLVLKDIWLVCFDPCFYMEKQTIVVMFVHIIQEKKIFSQMYGFHRLCWKCMYLCFGFQVEYEGDIRDPSIDSRINIDNIKIEVNDNASNGSVDSVIQNGPNRENVENIVTVSIPMASVHD